MKKIKNVKVQCYVCGANSAEAYLEKVKGEKDKYICEYCSEDGFAPEEDDGEYTDSYDKKAHSGHAFFDEDVEQDSYLYD